MSQKIDISIFDKIPSQTSVEDKESILFAMQLIKKIKSNYIYLEIGSHLGGSMQPFLADNHCQKIYSIDKRPESQPDERGRSYDYINNSSANMTENIRNFFGAEVLNKITIFDSDASNVPKDMITPKPDICFIDGEHTNRAVISDFNFCKKVSEESCIMLFHDAQYVFRAINKIKKQLKNESTTFKATLLRGCVYSIFLGPHSDQLYLDSKSFSEDEAIFFKKASFALFKLRISNKYPRLYQLLKTIKSFFDN